MSVKNAKTKKKPQVPPDEREKPTTGEQLDLIDVAPQNSKEIIKVAKRYKALQSERVQILADEIAAKKELLDLVKKSNPQRLEDGKITFSLDGFTITVTPRDELVKVKEKDEE